MTKPTSSLYLWWLIQFLAFQELIFTHISSHSSPDSGVSPTSHLHSLAFLCTTSLCFISTSHIVSFLSVLVVSNPVQSGCFFITLFSQHLEVSHIWADGCSRPFVLAAGERVESSLQAGLTGIKPYWWLRNEGRGLQRCQGPQSRQMCSYHPSTPLPPSYLIFKLSRNWY